jgi:hypothetical protein
MEYLSANNIVHRDLAGRRKTSIDAAVINHIISPFSLNIEAYLMK